MPSWCDHLSVDSSQYNLTLSSDPLSTSIPESSLAEPVSLLLRVIILSSINTTSEFLVVWLPEIVTSPANVTLPLKCAVPFTSKLWVGIYVSLAGLIRSAPVPLLLLPSNLNIAADLYAPDPLPLFKDKVIVESWLDAS